MMIVSSIFPVITVKSTRRENCNTFNLIAMEKPGTLRTPLGSSIQLNDVLFVINISDQGRSTVEMHLSGLRRDRFRILKSFQTYIT